MPIDLDNFVVPGAPSGGKIATSQAPSDNQAPSGSIDMSKFLPSTAKQGPVVIPPTPPGQIPSTYKTASMENGKLIFKNVTPDSSGTVEAPSANSKGSFVNDLMQAVKTPTTTIGEKLGNIQNVLLDPQYKLPTGLNWIKNVVGSGVKSVEGSAVMTPAEGLHGALSAIANPNATPLERFAAMGEGALKVGGVAFTQVAAELNAAQQLPGPLSWPAKGINLGLQKFGQGVQYVSDKGVDFLPISQKSKDTIKPLVSDLAVFTSQLVGMHLLHGAVSEGLGGSKLDIPIQGEFKADGENYVVTKEGDVLRKADYTKMTGQTGVYSKLPLTEELKSKISAGVKIGAGMSMQPFSTAFNLANGMILTKIAERKAKGIDITPDETKKIIDEVKKELPKNIEHQNADLSALQTKEKPIPFNPKEISDAVTSKLTNDTINGKDAEALLGKHFDPETVAKIMQDIPEKIQDHVGVIDTADLKRKIEMEAIQAEREGKPLTLNGAEAPASKTGNIDMGKFVEKGQEPTQPPAKAIQKEAKLPTETPVAEKTMSAQPKNEVSLPKETNKTSGLAKSIEAKAVEAKLTKGFGDLAEYQGTTLKEQAALTSDLISQDLSKAREIVRGEAELPGKMRGSALVVAMEEYLKIHPSADMAYELANSPLVSKASQAGSEIAMLQNREQDSATAKLQELRKAKEDAVDQKSVKEARRSAKTETEKVNLPKEELKWDNFLEKIKC